MGKRSGAEYLQNPGECPYCGSDNIDGGTDNEFEADSMISDGCSCRDCGKEWAEVYHLTGWIERDGDTDEHGNDVWHDDASPQAIEEECRQLQEERDKLRKHVSILEEALIMVAAHPLETDEDDEDVEEYERRSGSDAEEMLCICISTARAALEATKEMGGI